MFLLKVQSSMTKNPTKQTECTSSRMDIENISTHCTLKTARGHSRLMISIGICSSVGALALATQFIPTEAYEGGDSRRHRLRNHRSSTTAAGVYDGWWRMEEGSSSDAVKGHDGGLSKKTRTLAEPIEVEVYDGSGSRKRQNLSPPKQLLKGQSAESSRRVYDYFYEREGRDDQEGYNAGRSLARTTTTTMKKKKKKGFNTKVSNGVQKTSGVGYAPGSNVNVDADDDVNVYANGETTAVGGHHSGFNKHKGHPPGINKQGGMPPGSNVEKPSGGSSLTPSKVTTKTGAKTGKTKKNGNSGKMCPCPNSQGWLGGYMPPGGNGGAMAMYSIDLADGVIAGDPANPILSGGKADSKKSEKLASENAAGKGRDDTGGGESIRALQYGYPPSPDWWAPSGWQQPMCPCPTDPPTYLPTYNPTVADIIQTDNPTEIPTEIPTVSPTLVPTILPTAVFEGCPWYYWGGEEGRGLAVGVAQETPDLQLKEVIDLSAGSRHTFIIEESNGVYVSGFIESLSGYRGHLGVMRDRLSEGPNGFLSVKYVVNSANEIVPSPKFVQAYAGAGAPADSRGMHSLLIDRGGNVYTTGNNDKGQLCHGDLESRDMFRQVSSLPGPAIAAAVGLDFTQILLSDGRVFGCGNNENGELGLGPGVSYATTPSNKNGLSDIKAISAGLSFSLYLQADKVFGRNEGTVFGSGSNLYSQLCNSTGGETILVPKGLNVGTVTSIQAGRESSYFLDENGRVQSCGRNDQGQLGDGTFEDSDTPVKVDLPEDIRIRSLASGASSASVFFAADEDVVYAAGQNYQFQLGLGSIGSRNVPVLVEFEESSHEIVKISSSGTHTVAISCLVMTNTPTSSPTESPTVNPTLYPTVMPTINPTSEPTITPTELPTISPSTNVPTISPTYVPTIEPTLNPTSEPTLSPTLITDEPTLTPTLTPTLSPTLKGLNMFFWGAEEGRGNTLGDNQEVPQEIEGQITDVSAGSRHVFLIEEDGTAQAAGFIESGAGYQGHLGLGPVDTGCEGRDFLRKLCEGRNVPLPVTTVFNADGEKVDAPRFRYASAGVGVSSDSGAMHALLISEDGKAYVSGNNNKGQLCLGNKDPTDFFHEVDGIDNVVRGAVGEEFTLLVTESGKVYGCGSNEVGQLGEERLDLPLSTLPIEIKGGLNGITDVATGLGFALYLNGDTGEIWGSGSNIYGQLCGFTEGTPTTLPKILFEGVTDKVIQVEASRESSYFLFENGVARACGRNDEGQLGNGNFVNTSEEEPIVQVDLDEKILRLGSGPSSQSIFFIGEDGVWASGLNDRFQLGTGDIGSATKPVPVKFPDGPVDIEFISSSGSHTVANGKYL